jgi:uncharacterized SAM-binding protein YcdF (DUF218 family)
MPQPTRHGSSQALLRLLGWLLASAILVAVCLLLWGQHLLLATSPVPQHVDAAVVLQGSITAEKVRIAGAINLLQQGIADRVLLSVPRESYWGESIPPVARAYLVRAYGEALAARVDFCETGEDANSTAQEVQALSPCIQAHHWRSVVIVTSTYHTRRAGILWRKLTASDPNLRISVTGVEDPEFQQPWWRHRQSAKTGLMEGMKLVWTILGGR